MDFSSVTAKKIRQIRNPHKKPVLASYFSSLITENQHVELHAGKFIRSHFIHVLGDYHLIASDLRQIKEFEQKLANAALDKNQPTLFIAECVFVYSAVEVINELLKLLASSFSTAFLINYEQVMFQS